MRPIKDILYDHLILAVGLGLAYIFFQLGAAVAHADEHVPKYKIAIIDTGYDLNLAEYQLKLCKTDHFDFFTQKPKAVASYRHGIEIGSIIALMLRKVDYCAVIYNVRWNTKNYLIHVEDDIVAAIRMAYKAGANYINLSMGGLSPVDEERQALEEFTSHGGIVFTAAGNESQNLDINCNYYPACYGIEGVISVGAIDPMTGRRYENSNYGRVVTKFFSGNYHTDMGTSFASPRALAHHILDIEAGE